MKIINHKCVGTIINGISGDVNYNGKVINVPDGSRFEIIDGKMLINGKTLDKFNEADCPIIKIEITGNVNAVSSKSANVVVNGDVSNVSTVSGSVRCNTIKGNDNTISGDVKCTNIEGDVSTISGDIKR